MKKNILISLIILSHFAFSQNWSKQFGIPQVSYNVNSVKAFDANTVYYFNTRGDFSKSLDGGMTWTTKKVVDGALTYGFYFYDKNNGWASDYNGGIFRTTDAGETWTFHASGLNSFIRTFHFINSFTGWATGSGEVTGELLKTTDGGQTWLKQVLPGNNTLTIYNVKFINSLTGWVLGYRGNDYFLYNTTNGGNNWTLLPDPNTTRDVGFFNLMQFLDENIGFLVDQFGGFIHKTTNGGRSFTKLPNPAAIGTVQNFAFVNEMIGYTSDDQANIFKTIDGGLSWTQQTTGVPSGTLNGLSVVDANTAFSAGLIHQIKTTDGGLNWLKIGDERVIFKSIFPVSTALGYAVGEEGKILKTSNGSTWAMQQSGTMSNLNAVYFHNSTQGIVVGNSGTILQTNNGGELIGSVSGWNSITVSGLSTNLNGVSFYDMNNGYIVGDAMGTLPGMGTIFNTMDGGTTWSSVTGISSKNLKDVQLFSATLGWAVGASGTILKFDGTAWPTVSSGITTELNAIHFTNSLVGWAVGASNRILKTTDGGNTWTPQTSPLASTIQLNDVHFIDENNGWIAGNGALSPTSLLRTIDGGTTWKRIHAGVAFNMNTVKFLDNENGWLAGSGSINKYTPSEYLEFSGIPIGTPLSFAYNQPMPTFFVRMLNADGTVNTSYNSTISINRAGGGGTMTGITTQSAVNGIATFSGIMFNRPGASYMLEASANGLKAYSPTFNTTVIGANKLVIARLESTVMTNATVPSFIVAAQDINNFNSGAAYSNKPITLTGISGPGTVSGTLVKNTSSGTVSFTNISFNKRGVYVLQATDGTYTVTSSPITVGATQLTISGISNAIKYEKEAIPSFFVSAVDDKGKIDLSYNESITISKSSGSGTLSGIVTSNAVNGTATFSGITFSQNGSYEISVQSTDLPVATSNTINIHIKAVKLIATVQGSTIVGVNSLLGLVSVSAVNDNNQIDTTFGANVTIAKISGNGDLVGTTTTNIVKGVASISGLSVTGVGEFVLTVTSSSLTGTVFSIRVNSVDGINTLTGISTINEILSAITVSPNPFTQQVKFGFNLADQAKAVFILRDMTGRIIDKVLLNNTQAGQNTFEYSPENGVNQGMYLYELILGEAHHKGKLIYQK